jgi:hypothetical protein
VHSPAAEVETRHFVAAHSLEPLAFSRHSGLRRREIQKYAWRQKSASIRLSWKSALYIPRSERNVVGSLSCQNESTVDIYSLASPLPLHRVLWREAKVLCARGCSLL